VTHDEGGILDVVCTRSDLLPLKIAVKDAGFSQPRVGQYFRIVFTALYHRVREKENPFFLPLTNLDFRALTGTRKNLSTDAVSYGGNLRGAGF